MRLINVHTLELEEFTVIDPDIQKYAILSHTWGAHEVSFAEMTAYVAGETDLLRKKTGLEKIKKCCEQAKSDGYNWAWVDTCCIDKSSSAELSESINSMYRLYSESQVCYVYLADFSQSFALDELLSSKTLSRSRWFTRGWTLQELIAPKHLIFFSKQWARIGTKEKSCNLIQNVTGIDQDILTGAKELHEISIARRMSWASRRHTTRTEDIAYCLLGIFDINMPLLYGEGKKAFIRLQEEIIKYSDDHTIFAWADTCAPDDEKRGLLARSPRDFENSTNFIPFLDLPANKLELRLTNTGIYIGGTWVEDVATRDCILCLNCTISNNMDSFVWIYLDPKALNSRIRASSLTFHPYAGSPATFCILRNPGINRKIQPLTGRWLSIQLGNWSSALEITSFSLHVLSGTTKKKNGLQVLKLPLEKKLLLSKYGNPFDYKYLFPGPISDVLTIRFQYISEVPDHDGFIHKSEFTVCTDRNGKPAVRGWSPSYGVNQEVSCPGTLTWETQRSRFRDKGKWIVVMSEIGKTELSPGEIGMQLDLNYAPPKIPSKLIFRNSESRPQH